MLTMRNYTNNKAKYHYLTYDLFPEQYSSCINVKTFTDLPHQLPCKLHVNSFSQSQHTKALQIAQDTEMEQG